MMIYLASPYSHPDEAVRSRRYIATREFVHENLVRRIPIFSPIVYGHQFARDHKMQIDAATWFFFNEKFILMCDEVWVLKLKDWEKSVGVAQEIKLADELDLHIEYVEPLSYANF